MLGNLDASRRYLPEWLYVFISARLIGLGLVNGVIVRNPWTAETRFILTPPYCIYRDQAISGSPLPELAYRRNF
jgi:hypothetical protein